MHLILVFFRCWSANPVERPDMTDVVRVMEHLFQVHRQNTIILWIISFQLLLAQIHKKLPE